MAIALVKAQFLEEWRSRFFCYVVSGSCGLCVHDVFVALSGKRICDTLRNNRINTSISVAFRQKVLGKARGCRGLTFFHYDPFDCFILYHWEV